jgi:hypothetical protein
LTALHESHYLPCVAWFALAADASEIWLEKQEHFVKQTFRNRCYIITEHGLDSLHVPLIHPVIKTRICDIRIDNSQKWLNNHWRSIASAYGKSPFFEYYCDEFHEILFRKHDLLYDLNRELLTMCLRWLKWELPVKETMTYEKTPSWADRQVIRDFRGLLSPKKPDNTAKVYRPVAYAQVFGNAFVENASLIDLIFCCGPEAGRIVRASRW